MQRGRRIVLLTWALLAIFSLARASSEDGREQRMIRVERPLWSRLLAAPTLLVDAFHWPLKKFLVWGEEVRIDRRLRDVVLWKDNDDLAVPEPAKDDSGEHVWWDFYENTVLYPLERAVDPAISLPALGRTVGLASPQEAANANALDEVPDSTWFTNRHARQRLSAAALERGPNLGAPPATEGPLVVLSGKELGTQPGFWIRDSTGASYLVKFDPRGHPDLATAPEVVSSKILYALGWNVAEYHLFHLDPDRLVIDPQAWIYDAYNRKQPLTPERLARVLSTAERGSDGTIRASASRRLPGIGKGGFRMTGERGDDTNDTIPHEQRRDLRGLRVVAAWLDHVDFRSGNTLDTFVHGERDPPATGHLVHYLIDLNGTLGSWGIGWKPRWLGHEYVYETLPSVAQALHLWRPPWADVPLVHRSIGYFDAEHFDLDGWKPVYPAAPFELATFRDQFWGARLVASLDEADLHAVVAAGNWSDPAAADILLRILHERQRRIAQRTFDSRRINPLDELVLDGDDLRFRDLAVATGVAQAEAARYRVRVGDETSESAVPHVRVANPGEHATIELETSHDGGHAWSPPLRVSVGGDRRIVGLERFVR